MKIEKCIYLILYSFFLFQIMVLATELVNPACFDKSFVPYGMFADAAIYYYKNQVIYFVYSFLFLLSSVLFKKNIKKIFLLLSALNFSFAFFFSGKIIYFYDGGVCYSSFIKHLSYNLVIIFGWLFLIFVLKNIEKRRLINHNQ